MTTTGFDYSAFGRLEQAGIRIADLREVVRELIREELEHLLRRLKDGGDLVPATVVEEMLGRHDRLCWHVQHITVPQVAQEMERSGHLLSDGERRVLELKYGLLDRKARTRPEVAAALGWTVGKVQYVESRALHKLRDPAWGERHPSQDQQ